MFPISFKLLICFILFIISSCVLVSIFATINGREITTINNIITKTFINFLIIFEYGYELQMDSKSRMLDKTV